MWMIAANFRRTHSPSRLAWSDGWRPPHGYYYYYYSDSTQYITCSLLLFEILVNIFCKLWQTKASWCDSGVVIF